MCLHNHKSVFTRKSFASSQPFVFEAANNSMAGEQERQEEVANVEHWSLFHASLQLSSCSQNNCYPWLMINLQIELMAWWERSKYERHTTHQNLARRDLSSLLGLYNHFLREFIGPPVVAGEYKNVSITLYILLNSINFFISSHSYLLSSFFITDYSQVSVVDLNHAGQATISGRRQILIGFLQVSSFWTTEKCKCPYMYNSILFVSSFWTKWKFLNEGQVFVLEKFFQPRPGPICASHKSGLVVGGAGRTYLCNWMYICRARPSTDPYIIQNPIPEASVWTSAVTLEQQSASHIGNIQKFYRTRWPTLLLSFLLIEIAIVMDNRYCHCLLFL